MEPRFINLKDAKGRLRATVAYEPTSETSKVVKYAVTIVSPTEPNSIVSSSIGRMKTLSRLDSDELSAKWKSYGSVRKPKSFDTHGTFSAYSIIRLFNLQKIGLMEINIFRQTVHRAKKIIAQNTFVPGSTMTVS